MEEQLDTLGRCGIHLSEGVGAEDLLDIWSREDYEKNPYQLALVAMGGEGKGPDLLWSKQIWHLDTECIEDEGSYVAIANRMAMLAGGELPLENITDRADLDEQIAWVAFQLHGKSYKWDAKVKDDWLDEKLLGQFARLLDSQNASKRYSYLDLQGQDCLIGCCTEKELYALRRETGLDFKWLLDLRWMSQ